MGPQVPGHPGHPGQFGIVAGVADEEVGPFQELDANVARPWGVLQLASALDASLVVLEVVVLVLRVVVVPPAALGLHLQFIIKV